MSAIVLLLVKRGRYLLLPIRYLAAWCEEDYQEDYTNSLNFNVMESETTFWDLPPELKYFTFESLSAEEINKHVAKCSRNWRFLSCDASLWRMVNFNRIMQTETILRCLDRNQFIRRINFSNMSAFLTILNQHRAKDNTLIKHTGVINLTFTGCLVSVEDVTIMIEKFPNVQLVKIKDSRLSCEALLEMAKWKLRSISLIKIHETDISASLRTFMEKATVLEELTIGDCVSVSAEIINTCISLAGNKLTYLKLINIPLNYYSCRLISMHCSKLKVIKMFGPDGMTDYCLLLLLESMPSLTSLIIKDSNLLFHPSLLSAFENKTFPSLKELVLDTCENLTIQSLSSILKCCPNLVDLNITCIFIKPDENFDKIATDCRQLELLIVVRVPNMDRQAMEAIVKQLHKLLYCVCFQCPLIADGNLVRFVDNGVARMIKKRNYFRMNR